MSVIHETDNKKITSNKRHQQYSKSKYEYGTYSLKNSAYDTSKVKTEMFNMAIETLKKHKVRAVILELYEFFGSYGNMARAIESTKDYVRKMMYIDRMSENMAKRIEIASNRKYKINELMNR